MAIADNDQNKGGNQPLADSVDATPNVSEDQPEESTDYFAFRDPAVEESLSSSGNETAQAGHQRPNLDDEMETIDRKIVKKHFAPVLKQLKTKINPIHDAMKERERKYLTSMGIDTKCLDEANADEDHTETDSDSEGSETEVRFRARSKYDEMRTFLQEKQQISFMPHFALPETNGTHEDILE